MQRVKKNTADWMFLLFLIGATNVKLYIKLAVVVVYLLYCILKGYKFTKPVMIHWFYCLMPAAGFVGAWLHGSFDIANYGLAFGFGCLYWLLGGVICYLVYISIHNKSYETIYRTIKYFFAANALISLGELAIMIIESGHLMPYWYWEPTEYYAGATGDHIFGITRNISVTNAMISALGSIFFIINKELKWAALCTLILLLCTSNLTLIFLLGILIAIIVLYKKRQIKKYAFYILLLSAVIYPILTFDNVKYFGTVYSDDIQAREYTEEELELLKEITGMEWEEEDDKKLAERKIEQADNNYFKVNLHDSFATSYRTDVKYLIARDELKRDGYSNAYKRDEIQSLMKDWYGKEHANYPLATFHKPVKIYTNFQTVDYLLADFKNLIAGAGIGNFSSKQSIKTTGLGLQGSYPTNRIYASKSFLEYHMYSLLYVLGMPVSEHSIINMPNSIYNQIAGEYGLLGILLFLMLYVGFFWKHRRKLGPYIYLCLLMLAFFEFEYWFEMLTLTVIFELLLFLRIYHPDETRR